MFRIQLRAVEYFKADNFDVSSQKDCRELVIWLEDQKIRHYAIEDRASIREITNPNWPEAFDQYLNDVGCPSVIDRNDTKCVLYWLVSLAVKAEYVDNADKYKNATAENLKKAQNTPRIVFANPLDNMDFDSQEFKDGVMLIAKRLKITPHPNHLVTLKAISKLIKAKFDPAAIAKGNQKVEGKRFPLEESKLGFNTGDPVLDRAAKILRLLYIQDLRKLQTQINEIIVSMQKITANPKTDTKLGKVGF